MRRSLYSTAGFPCSEAPPSHLWGPLLLQDAAANLIMTDCHMAYVFTHVP